jgi:HD superfamily phosphohydrolase
MYRQVYQHRVSQSADALTRLVVQRIRDQGADHQAELFIDPVMHKMLFSGNYGTDLSLSELFEVNESWWEYHISHWRHASDPVVRDMADRLLNRKLFKTIHLPLLENGALSPEALQSLKKRNLRLLPLILIRGTIPYSLRKKTNTAANLKRCFGWYRNQVLS